MEDQSERPIRRKDRESPVEDARELLIRGEYGFLSLVGPAGEPYGVPISYVYHDGEIYFHSAPDGRKVDYFCGSARASFCVVGATELLPAQFATRYQSAIASGQVRELVGEEKIQALVWLVEKYSAQYLQEGLEYIASDQDKTRVFALHIRHLSGKRRA